MEETLEYVGAAYHKRTPNRSYAFRPLTAGKRPTKSLCDEIRSIGYREAVKLFTGGLRKGMVSEYEAEPGKPKYVWTVDQNGEAYETKWNRDGYHGYRLTASRDKAIRQLVLNEWEKR